MKMSIPYWQIIGFVFTGVVGTLLHFLFDWTGGSVAAAPICAVNESIWEHLKLLFYPMAVFAIGEYFCWGKGRESFWCIKLIGILIGFVLIVAGYYTYTGILGKSVDWFNITQFFLSAGVAFRIETKLFQRGALSPVGGKLAVVLIGLLAVAFTVLTFMPPKIPLFQDPVTGTYGFQG